MPPDAATRVMVSPTISAVPSFVILFIAPPAVTSILPAVAWAILMIFKASVSSITILPEVELSISTAVTFVSIALPLPTPLAASIVTTALAPVASISSPPVPPASVTAPLVLVMLTAEAVSFVVTKRPRAIFSSAAKDIVPLPASMTVPSTIVIAPPKVSLSLSASAVTVILPEVVVRSPAAANVTSSSAVTVIWVSAVTALLIATLASFEDVMLTVVGSILAFTVTVPVPAIETAPSELTLSLPSFPTFIMPPSNVIPMFAVTLSSRFSVPFPVFTDKLLSSPVSIIVLRVRSPLFSVLRFRFAFARSISPSISEATFPFPVKFTLANCSSIVKSSV